MMSIPVFKKTAAEDTYWALITIPFKVGVDKSWANICLFKRMEKKVAKFFPLVYNSLF